MSAVEDIEIKYKVLKYTAKLARTVGIHKYSKGTYRSVLGQG